jgi:hypothetical protein
VAGGQYVDFGDAYNTASFALRSATTRSIEGNVEGSIGASDHWVTVIALTTSNTTGSLLSTTGGSSERVLFDKLRINLVDNETTSATNAYLSAG